MSCDVEEQKAENVSHHNFMLPRNYRLTKKSDFDRVFKKGGKPFFSLSLHLTKIQNTLSYSRFGIVVSNKVSKKATKRNLIKRRIREILRKEIPSIVSGYDVVFVAKSVIIGKIYGEIRKELDFLLKKAGLYREKHERIS